MLQFPPAFPAGDIVDAGDDFQLANHVFNTLREHSYKEEKYAQRLHEKKEHSTHEQALDAKTRLMLFKMVDSGLLNEINGCVSTGKEAVVYHAEGGEWVKLQQLTLEHVHDNTCIVSLLLKKFAREGIT